MRYHSISNKSRCFICRLLIENMALAIGIGVEKGQTKSFRYYQKLASTGSADETYYY